MTADKKKKFITDLRRCVQPMQDLCRSYRGLDEAITSQNGETADGMNEDAIKNAKSIVYHKRVQRAHCKQNYGIRFHSRFHERAFHSIRLFRSDLL